MTTNFSPQYSLGNYVPEQIELPFDFDQFRERMKETVELHARLINRKDTGQYEEYEVPINQSFPGATGQQKRSIFRKIVNTGALPNAATKSVAHGISNIGNNWFFTRIYGTAMEPAGAAPRPFFIPLPNAGPNYQVQLRVDTTNINITTAVNLSAFTQSYVILEFWKA